MDKAGLFHNVKLSLSTKSNLAYLDRKICVSIWTILPCQVNLQESYVKLQESMILKSWEAGFINPGWSGWNQFLISAGHFEDLLMWCVTLYF